MEEEEEEEAPERKRLDEDPTTKVAPLRAKITADRRQAIAVSTILGARSRLRFTHTKKKKKKKKKKTKKKTKGATKIRFISNRSHLTTRAFSINYSSLFPVPSEAQETVSCGTEKREREREREREDESGSCKLSTPPVKRNAIVRASTRGCSGGLVILRRLAPRGPQDALRRSTARRRTQGRRTRQVLRICRRLVGKVNSGGLIDWEAESAPDDPFFECVIVSRFRILSVYV
jgi:hypothetical protein